jgi:TIR domain
LAKTDNVAAENTPAAESFFLSYSRADERFALRFAKDLRTHGVAIWVDQLDIRPSEHWDRAIERAVRDCRGMVVILSPRSAASDNVADEISFAIDSGKPVLPVMIQRCMPPLRITRMHMIDATASYDRALQQCLAEIARGTEQSSPPPRVNAARTKTLDPEVVAGAKRELMSIVGPIAGILVDKAASRASSAKELYNLLALHLDNDADRAHFATRISARPEPPSGSGAAKLKDHAPPQAKGSVIAAEDVERIAAILTTYLGPIAPLLSKRVSQTSASLQDLHERLAALIPDERDRTSFLNRLEDR